MPVLWPTGRRARRKMGRLAEALAYRGFLAGARVGQLDISIAATVIEVPVTVDEQVTWHIA
jgi:hypothetical protein